MLRDQIANRQVAWNVAHGLNWSALRYPRRIAVRDGKRELTYSQFNQRVNRLAHALTGSGIRRGERLLILLGDRIEHLEALFACAKVGIVAAPVDHRWRPEEVEHAVSLYDPSAMLFEEATRHLLYPLDVPQFCLERDYESLLSKAASAEAIQPVADSDLFCIGCSSGTSGLPKGIALSHQSMRWRLPIYAFDFGVCSDDLWLSITPLAQGGGRAFSMAHLQRGGSVLIEVGFDPERVIATIERERITTTFMVPTMFGRLLACPSLAGADMTSLRCVISTGAPLASSTRTGILEHLTPNFYQFYSSTESGGIASLPPWLQAGKEDSVGVGVFGKELRLEEDGEVLTRGPAVMAGYFGNDEATAAAFDGDWFRTGDLGKLDADGYLTIIGRKKDMIISGGMNVYPAEVERTLYAHPAIQEAAVKGEADLEWGEVVVAFVQVRAGFEVTADEVIEHCRARLASYKKPRKVTFVDELPRNSSGKISKKLLG